MQKPSRDTLLLVVFAGLTLLFLSWFYPPQTAVISAPPGILHWNAGFRPVFAPEEVWSDGRIFRVDHWGLVVLDLAIAAITASAIFSIRFERR